MASDYTVIISIEPFVRRFLYAQFGSNPGLPFSFPKRHRFNRLLEDMLFKPPADYVKPDYGENTFEIAIPCLEFRNEAVYNCMPETQQRAFNRRVGVFISDIFELKFRNLRKNQGLTKSEAIDNLTHEFGFLPEDHDRLIKAHQRWEKSEYNRKYRRKKKNEQRKIYA